MLETRKPPPALGGMPRPLDRRRMTLIVAVRSDAGIAIAADAQETVGNYRRAVQKIQARSFSGGQFIIAGSGNAGLIDSFILRVERAISTRLISSLQEFFSFIETELYTFYATDVALCPDADKSFRLFVGATIEKTNEFDVWISLNTQLHRITDSDMLGWDEPLYRGVLQRLAFPTMPLPQAVLAALYVLDIAKETSLSVGGDISISVVRPQVIWSEPPEYVKELESRLKETERELDQILLACADTSLSPEQLSKQLAAFAVTASELHVKHIKQVLLKNLLPPMSPYDRVPVDLSYYQAGGDVIMGREKKS